MKNALFVLFLMLGLAACGGGEEATEEKAPFGSAPSKSEDAPSYDPNRGIGKHKEVAIGDAIDPALVEAGKGIVGTKCASCHKFTDERLVGPGLKGITQRRTPVWLMNFITDPDPMIDVDPGLQEQLEICLVRMPNQNIADEEARSIIEFFRDNDTR